jgi:phage protein D
MGLGISILSNGTADPELAAAASVEVFQALDTPAWYRMELPIDIREGDIPWLSDPRIDAGAEIAVQVPITSGMATLVQGPVHRHHVSIVHGGEGSRLFVDGADGLQLMDHETKLSAWADVTDSEAVTSVIGTYGFIPDVESTSARHDTLRNTLIQRETDLFFLRRLARRNGCHFWLATDLGIHTVHWKKPGLDAAASADIMLNIDSYNIQNFELTWDTERPTEAVHYQVDAQGKSVLDGSATASPLTPLSSVSLADAAGSPRSIVLTQPANDASALTASAESELIDAGWFIQAACTTEFTALGGIVRAGELVTVRGLGSRHSGIYFVRAVHHRIDDTSHQIKLNLIRNAWGG